MMAVKKRYKFKWESLRNETSMMQHNIANTILSVGSTALDMKHMEWERNCREEDLEYRSVENYRRDVGKRDEVNDLY